LKVAFFDTKPYDIPGFEKSIENKNITIKFYEAKLCPDTVQLAEGYDVVCIFVNDIVNKEVIDKLYGYGVKLIALRCAGYKIVDIKRCYGKFKWYMYLNILLMQSPSMAWQCCWPWSEESIRPIIEQWNSNFH